MSSEDLGQVLSGLPPIVDPNVLVGFATHDDAGVYLLAGLGGLPDAGSEAGAGPGLALVATVDVFTPIVDDPAAYGRIAAANALSDVYAMGARPLFALAIIGFPLKTLGPEVMRAILAGGAGKAAEAGIPVIGGHSIDDAEPKYGLAVVGMVDPARVVRNSTGRAGDALVLTKPIGTGIVTQGLKAGHADPSHVARAVASMETLNREAAEAMLEVGVSAATDVTGFGLLGHLHELAHASGLAARLDVAAIPLLPGARALAQAGLVPGGSRRNLTFFGRHATWGATVSEAEKLLVADAQTSGGLLVALPAERAPALVAALARRGVEGSVIGALGAGTSGTISIG